MSNVLVNDDPLYEELYDVRREAEVMGNLVEGDIYPGLNALRNQAPVKRGFIRELLGLPEHHRVAGAIGRQGYVTLSYDACVTAFRDSEHMSASILNRGTPEEPTPLGLLEMDGPEHRGLRRALQPLFKKSVAFDWWRKRWIDETVKRLIERLSSRESAELNIDFCARIPVHTITTAIGLDASESLAFRRAYFQSTGLGVKSRQEQQEGAQIVKSTLFDLIEKRRAAPQDDIVSHLLSAEMREAGGSIPQHPHRR